MKVVFPCKGALVLLKQDVETLKAFYNTRLITSKLNEAYKQSNVMVQLGNFNYVPLKSSLVLYKANTLTIEKMRSILNAYEEQHPTAQPEPEVTQQTNIAEPTSSSSPISDSDILSNPFFSTLKPINN